MAFPFFCVLFLCFVCFPSDEYLYSEFYIRLEEQFFYLSEEDFDKLIVSYFDKLIKLNKI